MAIPRASDLVALRRLACYLAGTPRVVQRYPWQVSEDLDLFTDTDFAGCARTRRSTTAGVCMRGHHLLEHYSRTQKVVTLSSAEAELGEHARDACDLSPPPVANRHAEQQPLLLRLALGRTLELLADPVGEQAEVPKKAEAHATREERAAVCGDERCDQSRQPVDLVNAAPQVFCRQRVHSERLQTWCGGAAGHEGAQCLGSACMPLSR